MLASDFFAINHGLVAKIYLQSSQTPKESVAVSSNLIRIDLRAWCITPWQRIVSCRRPCLLRSGCGIMDTEGTLPSRGLRYEMQCTDMRRSTSRTRPDARARHGAALRRGVGVHPWNDPAASVAPVIYPLKLENQMALKPGSLKAQKTRSPKV